MIRRSSGAFGKPTVTMPIARPNIHQTRIYLRHVFAVAFALPLHVFAADNFATCLLDRMPGTENDVAAAQIRRHCLEKHPAGKWGYVPGTGRGPLNAIFGYESGAECASKLSKNTRSALAAKNIAWACEDLYGLPDPYDTRLGKHAKKLVPFHGELDPAP